MKLVNWIKDVIYNKSDSFVALVIICIAAALITWRIDVIMKYPQESIAQEMRSELSKDDNDSVNIDESDVPKDVSGDKSSTSSDDTQKSSDSAISSSGSSIDNSSASKSSGSAVIVDKPIDTATSSSTGSALDTPVS